MALLEGSATTDGVRACQANHRAGDGGQSDWREGGLRDGLERGKGLGDYADFRDTTVNCVVPYSTFVLLGVDLCSIDFMQRFVRTSVSL